MLESGMKESFTETDEMLQAADLSEKSSPRKIRSSVPEGAWR
jgi:hypothetical protein